MKQDFVTKSCRNMGVAFLKECYTHPETPICGECEQEFVWFPEYNAWIHIDFRKIPDSDLETAVDLIKIGFPKSDPREIELNIQSVRKFPEAFGNIYGLWIDKKLAGVVVYGKIYRKGWNGEAEIKMLAIHPDHRQKGFATWIIKTIIADLKKSDCPQICVVTLTENKLTNQIWKNFGFEQYATFTTELHGGMHNAYNLWLN